MSNDPIDRIKRLRRRLYPTGRAFNIHPGSNPDKLEGVAAEQNADVYNDALSILDTILPDNPNFTPDDATRWEERLGLIVDPPGVSFDDRKAAIIRKMNHPGGILARQSWDYIQDSLQTAGFDVYVHENIPEQTIEQLLSSVNGIGQQGEYQQGEIQQGNVIPLYPGLFTEIQQGIVQQGQFQQGIYSYNNKVANHIDQGLDFYFNAVPHWRSIFWIGDAVLGDFAEVPLARKDEFRQLILKLKPVNTAAYLLINYV